MYTQMYSSPSISIQIRRGLEIISFVIYSVLVYKNSMEAEALIWANFVFSRIKVVDPQR